MISAQHTPGPWVAFDNAGLSLKGRFTVMIGAYSVAVKRVEDAALIAASPDLLAACKSVLPKNVNLANINIPDNTIVPLDIPIRLMRDIHAAVAKAEGAGGL